MSRARTSRLGVALRVAGLVVRIAASTFFIVMAVLFVTAHHGSPGHPWHRAEMALALSLAAVGWAGSHLLLFRWLRDTRRLHRHIADHLLPLSPALARAAARVGLDDRVVELAGPQATAFTYGSWRPRVVVSRVLVAQLTEDELAAVLRHEQTHLGRLDPLRRSLLAVAGATFWYVPLLRHWQSLQVVRQEIAADRRAVECCGRQAVAGALFAVSRESSSPTAGPVAAMSNPALLGARIAHLEGLQVAEPPVLTRRLILVSALGLAGVVAVVGVAIHLLCLSHSG
ncbi:M56 family metallopeptidase [Streptomyces sp. NPDC094032]|uniref:M56 family metallopeptidase n=1 Tax=Streptomyces sp. NPDC094032 TaxID=3155308 RepID=UPI00332C4873